MPTLPVISFPRELVILAALGGAPNSGYGIGVDSVVVYETATVIYTTEVTPGEGCGTLQDVVSPAVAIRVDNHFMGQIRFFTSYVTRKCN